MHWDRFERVKLWKQKDKIEWESELEAKPQHVLPWTQPSVCDGSATEDLLSPGAPQTRPAQEGCSARTPILGFYVVLGFYGAG